MSSSTGRYARTAPLIVLLFLAVCPYFVDLDGSSIWDANEAFYVETPREMMERGFHRPRNSKPSPCNRPRALFFWQIRQQADRQ